MLIKKMIVAADDNSIADAITMLRNQCRLVNNGETVATQTITNLTDPTSASVLASGFDNIVKPIEIADSFDISSTNGESVFLPPIVEPWFAPEWDKIDDIIKDCHSAKDNESKYDQNYRLFWLDYYSSLKSKYLTEPIISFAVQKNKELSIGDADELIKYTSELSFDVVCDVLNFVLSINHDSSYLYTYSSYRDAFVILEYLAHKNTVESTEG